MKVITPLTIDSEVKRKAKEALLNMSEIAEDALRKRLGRKEVEVNITIKKCEFCGREGIRETADTINQLENGLTWLYPDEKWICNSCLSVKSRNVIK